MISSVTTPNMAYEKVKGDRRTFFNYTASKVFCNEIGLVWLGEDFILAADQAAWENDFSQQQVDIALRHHLWQVKFLFTPATYGWRGRVLMALYFLTGWKPE